MSAEVSLPPKQIVSAPDPPSMLSAPDPAEIVSFPAPPKTVSLLAPVVIESAPAPPVILNLPSDSADPFQIRALVDERAEAFTTRVKPAPTSEFSVVTTVAAFPSVTFSIPLTWSRSFAALLLSVNVSVSTPLPPIMVS